MTNTHRFLTTTFACLILTQTSLLHADEGMWLINHPPKETLKKRYGFEPTAAWLEHIQKSAVRFNSGGSGSFVSPDGLVMTNHHVGLETLQKLSTKDKDYVKEGFLARSRDQEGKSVDLELNVLMDIVDVTEQVRAAIKPGMTSEQAFKARRAVVSQIEKESQTKTGLRSNVVTLYQGGQYHLYRYHRYTDVRLVYAPEQQIAFFGGDPDNFEYPRYDLDVCLFRVYENGVPVKSQHYLKWSKAGPSENELVFVAGHPGRTDRLNTVADLTYLRDTELPMVLARIYRKEVQLTAFSSRSIENARLAKDELFSYQNNRKRREWALQSLLDPHVWARKMEAEKALRHAVAQDKKLSSLAGAWDRIEQVQKIRAQSFKEYVLLEAGWAFDSLLFGIARTLVRAAEELPKPNEQRLEEYADSDKASLELKLFSKRPIHPALEEVKLVYSLTWLAEHMGANHPLVLKVLAGQSPKARAAELVRGTGLTEVELRRRLYAGGSKAIAASADPMILLAKLVDPDARAVRKLVDTQVKEVQRQCYDQIAQAKFAVEGTSSSPDATFTLRLAFGVAKGYEEDGRQIPFTVPYAGLYERAAAQKYVPPFNLPPRWVESKDRIDLTTPINFVSTCDTIGGNSGSPVINKDGELVGLIFDSNLHALVRNFLYTEERGRSVAVHSSAIIEAIRKVYDAPDLAAELTGAK